MSRLILPLQGNKLAYPGRTPGFDPSHPASAKISGTHGFSGVASGNTFLSLARAQKPSAQGVSSASIRGDIGPNVIFTGSTTRLTFTSPAVNDASQLCAGIFNLPSVSGTSTLFQSGAGNGGTFFIGAGTVQIFNPGTGQILFSGLNPVAGVPYFVIWSYNSSKSNGLLLNLQTGQVQTITGIGGSIATSSGAYWIGIDNGTNFFAGSLAAVMFSPQFMSIPQMLQWAQDPWAFWYP